MTLAITKIKNAFNPSLVRWRCWVQIYNLFSKVFISSDNLANLHKFFTDLNDFFGYKNWRSNYKNFWQKKEVIFQYLPKLIRQVRLNG